MYDCLYVGTWSWTGYVNLFHITQEWMEYFFLCRIFLFLNDLNLISNWLSSKVSVEWGHCSSFSGGDGTQYFVVLRIPPRGPSSGPKFLVWVFFLNILWKFPVAKIHLMNSTCLEPARGVYEVSFAYVCSINFLKYKLPKWYF